MTWEAKLAVEHAQLQQHHHHQKCPPVEQQVTQEQSISSWDKAASSCARSCAAILFVFFLKDAYDSYEKNCADIAIMAPLVEKLFRELQQCQADVQ